MATNGYEVSIIAPLTRREAASEGGGQHWTVRGDDILGLTGVQSGDLVVGTNNCLVGVAMTDYNADGGLVTLDITGCWFLPVFAYGNVTIGDWIYFHLDNGSNYLDNYEYGGKPIGQAMDTVIGAGGCPFVPINVPVKLTPCCVDNRGNGR